MTDSLQKPVKLLILGTGTFAMDVADLVSDIPNLEVVGFVASMPPYEPGSFMLEKPIYWVDELTQFDDAYRAVCALVTTKRYHFTQQAEALGMRFTSVIHPTARVSRMATVADGCVINAGVQVPTHTQIGRHVVVNRGALLGHHNTIHNHATISPGAVLAGNVTIGQRAWVGVGANVLEKRTIGEQSIVGSAALVTRDVPARVKVMGIPAKIVEEGIDGL
ncbi:MAG: acetyltransferase [Chloroflexi bacterium]|nr:MAG: acetyltransferase [Chloroflexota bacterium]